jgi:hypothetical protein
VRDDAIKEAEGGKRITKAEAEKLIRQAQKMPGVFQRSG